MIKRTKTTKAMLIREIKVKVRTVHPWVKGVFLRGLKYKTKAELTDLLNKARVTRGRGISLS